MNVQKKSDKMVATETEIGKLDVVRHEIEARINTVTAYKAAHKDGQEAQKQKIDELSTEHTQVAEKMKTLRVRLEIETIEFLAGKANVDNTPAVPHELPRTS
jgi:hypothetical protein